MHCLYLHLCSLFRITNYCTSKRFHAWNKLNYSMIKYISVNMNLLSYTEHCHMKKKLDKN